VWTYTATVYLKEAVSEVPDSDNECGDSINFDN
jgi:hypothetical protein